MADVEVLDKKAVEKQAEAGNKANAEYSDPVRSLSVPPHLPDYEALAEQRQVHDRADDLASGPYEGVEIKDDGTRVGKGLGDTEKAKRAAQSQSQSSDDK